MKLYNDFYSNFVQMDSGFETKPQLVLVCEDDKHMVETFKIIVEKNLEIPGIKLCFTTDLKQNQTTLEKTLIEFKLDETTKKYKIEEIPEREEPRDLEAEVGELKEIIDALIGFEDTTNDGIYAIGGQ